MLAEGTVGRVAQRWLLIFILFSALGLRLYALTLQDIWWDEARNIDVALRPLFRVSTSPELDIHPPVYFWLLHIWGRMAGVSMELAPAQIAYLMRYVSVTAGVVGVALLFSLTRAISSVPAALLAAAIGAFSPFWLAESQEARMYTVGFTLLMGASLFLLRSLPIRKHKAGQSSRSRWRSLTGFAVLSAVALATHYNAVFILVAWYLWWGLYAISRGSGERLREIGMVALTGLGTLLLVLPAAPIAMRQIPGYANPNLSAPSAGEYLWQNWQAYIGGYAFSNDVAYGMGTAWLWVIFSMFTVGLALCMIGIWMKDSDLSGTGFSFVLFWLAGGLALYYLAVLDRGAFNVRYSSFVTPALYTLLAIGIVGLRRLSVYLVLSGAIVLFLGFVPGIRADLHDERFAREDVDGLTQWLRSHAGPNDLILVDQKYPFGFYYDRYSIDPDDEPIGAEPASAIYMFVDINNIDEQLNERAAAAENVYWVQWFESDTDPRRAVSFLLDKEGARQGEEWFNGYSVDWWRLDPPNSFELAPQLDPLEAQFGQAVRALEVSLPQESVASGGKAPFVMRWQRVPDGRLDRPLKARVAVYDKDGSRIAQVDKRILNDRHLLAEEWSMTDAPLNVYMVDLPEELASGEYAVRLLVYDADSLEPISLLDAAGNPIGHEADLGAIQIVSEQ